MKPKWKKLAAEMLRLASDQFSRHACNDWEFPDDWTEEERLEFVREMYSDASGIDLEPADWAVMDFLAEKLDAS